MSESEKSAQKTIALRSLKAMTIIAAFGWVCLIAVFVWQNGVPKYLEWLYGLFTPMFFISQICIAAAYTLFRAIDLIHNKSWSDYSAWTWLPTISFAIALILLGLKSAVYFKSREANSKDLQALQSGQLAETAQRRYFSENHGYAKDLDDLLRIDPEIESFSDITFHFTRGDQSGYRFSTRAKGSMVVYPFSDKGFHPFGELKVEYAGDPEKGGLPRRKITDHDKENPQ